MYWQFRVISLLYFALSFTLFEGIILFLTIQQMYARVHSLSKNISETAISSGILGIEPQVLTISYKVTLEKKEEEELKQGFRIIFLPNVQFLLRGVEGWTSIFRYLIKFN